jgi:hypothetical protein
MAIIPAGGNAAGGSSASGPATPAHALVTSIGGELIGVIILAIFADMNDELGGWAVALMAAWFVVFLMINAPALSGLVGKV